MPTQTFTIVDVAGDDGFRDGVAIRNGLATAEVNNWAGDDDDAAEDQEMFVRFQNVVIAKSSTIVAATLRQTSSQTHQQVNQSSEMDIYGLDEDDSAQIADVADLASRPRTTAKTNVPQKAYTNDVEESWDVAGIIQEIVNRSGWSSGNALQLLLTPVGATRVGLDLRGNAFYTANTAQESRHPQLDIEWTEGGGGGGGGNEEGSGVRRSQRMLLLGT